MTVIAAAYKPGKGILPASGAIGCDSMVSGGAKGLTVTSKILALSADKAYPAYGGIAGAAVSIERIRAVPLATGITTAEAWEEHLRTLAKVFRDAGERSSLLTLSKWGIWEVMPDGVFKLTTPVAGIGSGGDIALGTMVVGTKKPLWSPRAVVTKGLEAACDNAPGCGRPLIVHTV
jgi:ATP-dependent protease HslVU (ClpYQ) peptidase subunit